MKIYEIENDFGTRTKITRDPEGMIFIFTLNKNLSPFSIALYSISTNRNQDSYKGTYQVKKLLSSSNKDEQKKKLAIMAATENVPYICSHVSRSNYT